MCGFLGIPYRKGTCGLDIDHIEEFRCYPWRTMRELYLERFREFVDFLSDSADITVNLHGAPAPLQQGPDMFRIPKPFGYRFSS
jgi:hypothetical protein